MKRSSEWLPKCNKSTELCTHQVIKFQTLSLLFWEPMKRTLVTSSLKFIWSVIKVKLLKGTTFLLIQTIENSSKSKLLKVTNKPILLLLLEVKMHHNLKHNSCLLRLLMVHQNRTSLPFSKNQIFLLSTETNLQEGI